LGHRRR